MAYDPVINPANRPRDLSPEGFSGVGGSIQSQAVISLYDIYKPYQLMNVFERHANYKPGFRLMLKTMGFNKGAQNPSVGHYEYPWATDLITIGSIVSASAGAGNSMIVSLAAGNMFDPGVTVGGSARKASIIRKGDLIKFLDGKKAYVVAKDTTTDPHRITIRPVKAADDLDNSVNVGESYFIADNAWAEGSGLPSGMLTRVIKYTNNFQISKERCGATGSEMTNQTYFHPLRNKPGSFYLKTEYDTYRRFERKCDKLLLWGSNIDNITMYVPELEFDVPVKGTEGLIEFIETNSLVDTYTVGAYALDDFDELGNYYEDERIGSRQLIMWLGSGLYTEIENVLLQLFNNDMDVFTLRELIGMAADSPDDMQKNDSSDIGVNIGFKGLRKNGYTFALKLLSEFNHPKEAGADGYDYKSRGVIMPLGYTKDKSTGDPRASVGYEYKKLNGYSREEIIASLNGVGVGGNTMYGTATSESDIRTLAFLTEMAFHATCANHVVMQKPA